MTADISTLGEIHQQLAMTYRRLVSPREEPMFSKDGEPILDADGNQLMRVIFPTAAELSAANAFLKQNNITSAPEEDEGMEELRKQLASQRKKRAPVLPDYDGDFGVIQ